MYKEAYMAFKDIAHDLIWLELDLRFLVPPIVIYSTV